MNVTQENNGVECSICLEELDNGMETRVLQCGHIFHSECVDLWIKQHFTCPYCRHCEANINCYWLTLKAYGLSWFNKIRKYKYTLKRAHIEISRKNYVHRINLDFIRRILMKENTIKFFFLDGKKTTLFFSNPYPPFMALKQRLNEYYERQRAEIQRQRIQQQIRQIEQMERFRPVREAWVEEPQIQQHYINIDAVVEATDLDALVEDLD